MAFINKLCIDGYRGIRQLKIGELKQVNLVVGDNNCGKTSVLEALQMLRTSGNLANVYRVARLRDSITLLGSNSIFDSFICMFPKNNSGKMEISVSGTCDDKDISFVLDGRKNRVLLDTKELPSRKYIQHDIEEGEIETEAFDGTIRLKLDGKEKKTEIHINQYSSVTGTPFSDKDQLRNESYKQICIKALQLFDPDIEDLMIFKSDIGNRPVEYIRHKLLGDMPVSSYGDGIKKVLALSNGIAMAAGGILLIDEIETAIHKKYYDDIFRFIVKACKSFKVQAFITTHSIEAIDGLLETQDYDIQHELDDICVCTIKRTAEGSVSRVLTGREVYENRESIIWEKYPAGGFAESLQRILQLKKTHLISLSTGTRKVMIIF